MRPVVLAVILLTSCGTARRDAAAPQAKSDVPSRPSSTSFSRSNGGSLTTTLSFGIKVNPNTSLQREWITAHDSLSPADLSGTVGVVTVYREGGGYVSSGYEYQAVVPVTFKEDVTALEVRFVLFDVWGQFTKTLSETEVEDASAGTTKTFRPRWRILDENEVSEHYASLGYIARMRTKAGRVFEANYRPILEEARTISAKFQPEWLEPNAVRPSDSTHARR